jgi:hypothetical protein
VSHLPERVEKVCLNCNAALEGRFCHICGQENIEPREGFWNMLTHFVFDFFHFDGKFFSTLKFLLFKPGFLSQEHLKGRRASYLHPIRMYIFTSTFFFLIFFNFFQNTKEVIEIDQTTTKKVAGDTAFYNTLAEYDSIQNSLSPVNKKGYIPNKFKRQMLYLNDKYDGDFDKVKNVLLENFLHAIPSLLFVSLPLFAFVLFLLYWRSKKYFYSDHLLYTLHIYCAFFILILVSLVLSAAIGYINKAASEWVSNIVALILIFYWYKSIRHFYRQSTAKTVFKFILLFLVNLVLLIALFVGFFLFSVMTIH